MLTPDQLSASHQRKMSHVVASLLGDELRLSVRRQVTWTAHGKVTGAGLDEGIEPEAGGARVNGPADGDCALAGNLLMPHHWASTLEKSHRGPCLPSQRASGHPLREARRPDAHLQQLPVAGR